MLDLILIYKWTILAGVLAAPALALLGVQLATRDRAMQTLCIGQGAMLGVLFGLGMFATLHIEALHGIEDAIPFITAFLVAAGTYLVSERMVANTSASKNTFFAFLLALLMSGSYLMSTLFPALENHMSQIYFGDLATLTEWYAQIMIVSSILALGVLVGLRKSIANTSFELAVFGMRPGLQTQKNRPWFQYFSLLVLCFSVQYVGFLFTIAMLFVPTSILKFMKARNLRTHQVLAAAMSILGMVTGFVLSLEYTRLPTVPTIVVATSIYCFIGLGTERLLSLMGGVKVSGSVSDPALQMTGGRG